MPEGVTNRKAGGAYQQLPGRHRPVISKYDKGAVVGILFAPAVSMAHLQDLRPQHSTIATASDSGIRRVGRAVVRSRLG